MRKRHTRSTQQWAIHCTHHITWWLSSLFVWLRPCDQSFCLLISGPSLFAPHTRSLHTRSLYTRPSGQAACQWPAVGCPGPFWRPPRSTQPPMAPDDGGVAGEQCTRTCIIKNTLRLPPASLSPQLAHPSDGPAARKKEKTSKLSQASVVLCPHPPSAAA